MSTECMIAKLQAAGVAMVPSVAAFEVTSMDAELDALWPKERELVSTWAPHRQREFSAGRHCARRALLRLGSGSAELLPDLDGVPQWPKDFGGCISHSRGIAMALVSRLSGDSLLGLDLEKTNRLSAAAIQRVVHPLEEDFVQGNQLHASILFSMKEAFYKAQFPRWRTRGNFHDVVFEIDLSTGLAQMLQMDARFASELAQLQFQFRLVDDYVLTVCWM